MSALYDFVRQTMNEQAIEALAWSLVHFLWQGIAIVAVLSLILWLLQSARPTIRYAVCLIGLFAMLACPIVTLTCFDPVPTAWRVTDEARDDATRKSVSLESFGTLADVPLASSIHDHNAGSETSRPPGESDRHPMEVQISQESTFADEGDPVVAGSSSATDYVSTQAPRWIVGIWLVGVGLFGLRLLLSWIGVWRLRTQVAPVPDWVISKTEQLAKRLRVAQPLIRTSQRVTEAIAVGFLKPMILLPTSWLTELPPDMLEAIIAHELAHIRRGDLWVNLFQRVVEALLFYHPMVWWLSRRIRIERELCCDAMVVEATQNRLLYAETLEHVGRLSLARSANRQPSQPALSVQSVGSQKMLLARIRSVLQADRQRASPSWPAVAAMLVVGCMLTIALFQFASSTSLFGGNSESEVMKDIEADFEQYATELTYLKTSDVLFDRVHDSFRRADPKLKETYIRTLASVTDPKHSLESLQKLLSHDDPKVRTLAAVALFDRNDPKVLPSLVKLCNDDRETFPGIETRSAAPQFGTGIGGTEKRQTVGEVADAMVVFYLERAGFYYGIEHSTKPDWSDYWAQRQNRDSCASWFDVKLARACQGTSPTRAESIPKIRALRTEIDQLDLPERVLTLLRLHGEYGGEALVTEQELIEGCQQLGSDKLMQFLQHKPPVEDPDLQPRGSNNWFYNRMSRFLLQHSSQLLRPDDSDKLLACEQWQRDYQKNGISDPNITALWAIAAARLKPEKAAEILHEAMSRFQRENDADDRAQLCTALLQLVGESEMQFVVDWFYGEVPQRGQFPHCRSILINSLKSELKDATLGKALTSRLVQDARFSELDWQSLKSMILVVNDWRESPLATHNELHNSVSHPMGEGRFHWQQDEARQEYPEETKKLYRNLEDWRGKLREEVSQWDTNTPNPENIVLDELEAIALNVGKHEASDAQLSRTGELLQQLMAFSSGSPYKARGLKTLARLRYYVDGGTELGQQLDRCVTLYQRMPGGNIQRFQTPVGEVMVSIGLEKPNAILGEPNSLVFTIENLSDRELFTIKENSRNQKGRPNSFQVVATGSDGQQVELVEIENFGGRTEPVQIPAGKTWSRNLFLPNWFLLSEPGEYTIQCRTKSCVANSQDAAFSTYYDTLIDTPDKPDPEISEDATVIDVELSTPLTVSAAMRSRTLNGRFVFNGKPEATGNLDIPLHMFTKDGKKRVALPERKRWADLGVPDESLIIGKDGGIANVVVWAMDVEIGDWNGPLPWSSVTAKQGRFEPHVLPFWNLAKLRWVNEMPERVNFQWDGARSAANVMLGQRGVKASAGTLGPEHEFETEAARFPIPLKSNLHPWMRSYILPLKHPCFAVTDKSGRFEIKHLPKGEHEFAIWHESVGWLKTKKHPTGRFKFNFTGEAASIGDILVEPGTFPQQNPQNSETKSHVSPSPVGEKPPTIPVVTTWKQLHAERKISLGQGNARVGIDTHQAKVNGGVVLYCLTDGYETPGEWESYNRLGPLRVEVWRPPRRGLKQAAIFEKRHDEDTAQATVLFRKTIPIHELGVHEIRLTNEKDQTVAALRLDVKESESHPWMAFRLADLGTFELDEDFDAVARFQSRGGYVMPTLDGKTPLVFQRKGKPRKFELSERLPGIRPEKKLLRLAAVDDRVLIESPLSISLNSPHKRFLVRWWVNGNPAGTQLKDELEKASSRGEKVMIGKKLLVDLEIDRKLLNAKLGDKLEMQVMYCKHGWAGREKEMVFWTSEEADILLSNRLELKSKKN